MDDFYVVEIYWPSADETEHIYIVGRENADKYFDTQIKNWIDDDYPVHIDLYMYKAHVTPGGIITYDWSTDLVRSTEGDDE